MGDLVTIGVVLLIVLAIVTVVGHGIWALLAYLFGGGGREHRPQFRPVRRCPACDVPLLPGFAACGECGWPRAASQESRNLAVLRELTRQVEDFGQRSLLDPLTRANLLAAIHQQQERSAPKPAPAPAPAAEPAAPRPAAAKGLDWVMVQLVGRPEPAAPRPAASKEAVEAELVPESTAEAAGPEYAVASEAAQTRAPRLDPRERAERYAARRTAAAHSVAEPAAATPPRPPARPWSEILAAFMEQRHIRWGELIGGLLIVCCSIALVISFWAEIDEQPFLKFFVFNGVTAALFGLGVYTFRRWKLETTSHGLLLIATLLVPLNFLAIAAVSTDTASLRVITLGGEAISVVVFSALVYYAGKIVMPRVPLLLTASVIVPSVLALVIRRHVGPESSFWLVFGLAAALAACYSAANLVFLSSSRRWEQLDESGANAIFKLLGVSTFALALPLALLLVKTTAVAETLHRLAPLATLLGLPALAAGLLFWQRITDRERAMLRTAGTNLAVLGVAVMLAGIGLAWPDPSGMLPAALVNFAVLTGVAILFAMPAAHLLAALCLSIFGLLAGLLIWGDITWSMTARAMAAQSLSAHAAVVLVAVSAVLAGGAALLVRLAGRAHGLWYLAVAAAAAATSLLLVTRHGFAVVGDTSGAVWIYAVYAAACLAAAVVGKRAELTWAGAGLLLAALVQGLAFTFAPSLEIAHPWLAALLVHSTAMTAGALVSARRGRELEQAVQFPLTAFAIASSLAAAAVALWLVPQAAAGVPAVASAVLAILWLCLALMERQGVLMVLSQASLASSVVFGVASILERQSWVAGWETLWLDPWSLQAQGIALCGLAVVWLTVRIVLGRAALGAGAPGTPAEHQASHPPEPVQSFGLVRRLEELVDSIRPSLDHVLAAVSLAILVVLAVYGAAPGVAQELSPRWAGAAAASANRAVRTVPPIERFELDGIGHEHALDVGSWLLLGSLMLLLAYSLWHRYRLWKALALLLAASATVPLLGGLFEPHVAVASAMRWLSTGYLVLGSVVVWYRTGLVRWLQSIGALPATGETAGGSRAMRSGVIALALAPLVVMGFYVAVAALVRVPPRPDAASLLWIFGILFIVVATVALVLRRAASDSAANAVVSLARQASALVLVLGAGPLVAMTLYVVAAALKQQPILGPELGSFFARIGQAASYALPILVTALVVVGYALRDRDTGFAFAGGLVMAVAATSGYLLAIAKTSAGLDLVQWVRLAQLNASVAAVYCLGWIAVVAWASSREARLAALGGGLLATQVVLPVALHLLVLVPAAFVLVVDPLPAAVRSVIGDAWGWGSAVLALAAVGVFARQRQMQFAVAAGAALLLAVGTMLACSLNPWDNGNWLSFHAFLVAVAASAWAALVAGWLVRRRESPQQEALWTSGVTAWSTALGVLTVFVGLRALGGDPQSPWWSMAACACVAALAAALACWSLYRIYLYAAALLVNMTATIGWSELGTRFSGIEFVEVNTLALGLAVPVWLAIELAVLRPARGDARRGMIPVHRPAAWFAAALVALIVASGLVADLASSPIGTASALGWAALVAGVIGMAATLWDERMRSSVAGLYLLGLLACGMLLDSFDLEPRWIVWTGTMILAAFSLGTSYLWSRRAGLLALADRLRIPHSEDALAGHYWLVPANCLLAASVTALAFGVELSFAEFSLRFVAAKAVVAQAIAIGLLARGRRRSQLQYASLGVGALGAVALGWSVLEPATTGSVLNYAVAVLAALATVTALYGIGLSKIIRRENEWTAAAGRLTPVLVATGTATVFLILGIEVIQFVRDGNVAISWTAKLIVIAALAGIFLTCLAAALIPGRDPFDLPERGRMVYVYAAEGVLALLFVHVRVTMPWLFGGFFMLYWPMIVILLGFLGVGLSELFRRQKRIVLAEPLERTGAFLPLLPVVGFWFVDNQVHFSLLMLAVGALYAALAVTRRSFAFGVLAAVAANGGLWYFLHHTGSLGLLAHPQLWFIPPALCLLAAAYLNRQQLTDAQMTSIRYFSSTVIYVSSTADIFLNGVAEAPWLPLVLAALSIAGIFAGIMLRVRGFLFLGTSFLMLSLLTIIWHAAVNLGQTWLWSVTGIVAGILIIALFAVFEKKRQDILRLADQLKQWQA